MTKNEELAMSLLMEAAWNVNYRVRTDSNGFVCVVAPAKVCELCEEIHKLFVSELDRRDALYELTCSMLAPGKNRSRPKAAWHPATEVSGGMSVYSMRRIAGGPNE